jgi:hypothetical protein
LDQIASTFPLGRPATPEEIASAPPGSHTEWRLERFPLADGYYESILSMPVGRPRLGDLLDSIGYCTTHDYPARREA